eukprot:CAMPEP_0176319908 /NCGR_PEP_ID=MMETSP0121_2-20121125/70548_1 /TAXON_ID=160619 /ORGANISM="Kryptoperidinium foliaceum, Strain CCMP 1326" /LENGTH=50 /DNA_ID=CAMNT_0017662279 /DNA_START=12 /DNA_END=161 /DNA_ORIENTATION=-
MASPTQIATSRASQAAGSPHPRDTRVILAAGSLLRVHLCVQLRRLPSAGR